MTSAGLFALLSRAQSTSMSITSVHQLKTVTKKVDLTIGGDTSVSILDVPYLHSYAPTVGDFVLVLIQDAALIVLGNIEH